MIPARTPVQSLRRKIKIVPIFCPGTLWYKNDVENHVENNKSYQSVLVQRLRRKSRRKFKILPIGPWYDLVQNSGRNWRRKSLFWFLKLTKSTYLAPQPKIVGLPTKQTELKWLYSEIFSFTLCGRVSDERRNGMIFVLLSVVFAPPLVRRSCSRQRMKTGQSSFQGISFR